MSDRIAASLRLLFEEHRLVFWYDADRDMRAEFDAVDLPGVTKLEMANNEFGLKYRILRQEPKGRYLLFKDGPEPEMTDNWLLDLQLASAVFKADQAAIWLAELGLPRRSGWPSWVCRCSSRPWCAGTSSSSAPRPASRR